MKKIFCLVLTLLLTFTTYFVLAQGPPFPEPTPEEKLLEQIRQQPDYQQITIQEYSAETKNSDNKIMNVTRHVHQSESLNKRVDTIRQWLPIYRDGKCVGHNNQGSILEIKNELYGKEKAVPK